MKRVRIDITKVISADLKSRLAVSDFMLYIKNTGNTAIDVDFANVKFATRSFEK